MAWTIWKICFLISLYSERFSCSFRIGENTQLLQELSFVHTVSTQQTTYYLGNSLLTLPKFHAGETNASVWSHFGANVKYFLIRNWTFQNKGSKGLYESYPKSGSPSKLTVEYRGSQYRRRAVVNTVIPCRHFMSRNLKISTRVVNLFSNWGWKWSNSCRVVSNWQSSWPNSPQKPTPAQHSQGDCHVPSHEHLSLVNRSCVDGPPFMCHWNSS